MKKFGRIGKKIMRMALYLGLLIVSDFLPTIYGRFAPRISWLEG